MKPFFSIIIPYHNSIDTIGPLLDSIKQSKGAPLLEVIIVDDGSRQNMDFRSWVLDKKQRQRSKIYDLRTIIFKGNKGPAKARNAGAKIAKGKFIVFLDGDVRLFPDALANLAKIYQDDPDIVAVTGVWSKHQQSKAFFPNFKALRDWSYWLNERDVQGYYFLFSTRIASIKRAVFVRLKGFDEVYAGPLVEDIEFTYRIARRYAIIFAPTVRVHHEFEGFSPIARKYFWRTYYWTKLFERRKKFDPVATTSKEALTSLTAVGALGLFLMAIMQWVVITIIFNPPAGGQFPLPAGRQEFSINFQLISLQTAFVLFCIHLFLVRKFLVFVYQEKGMVFAIKSFFMGIVLYCFITAGAVWGKIR